MFNFSCEPYSMPACMQLGAEKAKQIIDPMKVSETRDKNKLTFFQQPGALFYFFTNQNE